MPVRASCFCAGALLSSSSTSVHPVGEANLTFPPPRAGVTVQSHTLDVRRVLRYTRGTLVRVLLCTYVWVYDGIVRRNVSYVRICT